MSCAQMGTQIEILDCTHNQFDISEGSLPNKFDLGEEENHFYDVRPTNCVVRGGLKEWIAHAFELKRGGINIEIVDFHDRMHMKEQEYNLLDPIYDEYPKESKAAMHRVQGESSTVREELTTTTEGEEESNRAVDALSQRSSLLKASTAQVKGFKEVRDQHQPDPYISPNIFESPNMFGMTHEASGELIMKIKDNDCKTNQVLK
ncbi:hypothetical protein PVK06_030543 [Gossypium arboreum]|uniref:Uncharacterized protein n=1 Tax=Gossypium arboreum TaxID=29729 RepID=A0ABR0NR43_GOSAR|nr:hypothetical protein PVK06_030543 [Gossypium arboreum]